MADKSINELPLATTVQDEDLFVLEQTSTAKSLRGDTLITFLGNIWEAFGGITGITQYWAVSSSNTTAPSTWYTTLQTMTATNRYLWSYMTITFSTGSPVSTTKQVIGVYGDKGDAAHVFIKYAPVQPTYDAQMSDTPDKWMGVYAGNAQSAPTSYTSYRWYQIKGDKGDTGVSIESVSLYSTSGLVDTYRVVFDNNTYTTFQVTNGSNISTITKTSTAGLVDTYTVLLTNGDTTTFQVTNAKSIDSITMISGSHAAGTSDTYRITYNDGDSFDFEVYNGANGLGSVSTVSGIQAVNGDVPQVIFGNGAPTQLTVGQEKQLYFDTNTGSMYVCFGESQGSYVWMGATVTIDSALSTTSTNAVQNKVITGKVGTASLNTTAQNLSGAINEHETDITNLNTKVGSAALITTSSNLSGAVNELAAFEPITVSWTLSSSALTYSNAAITSDMKVIAYSFGTPSAIHSRPSYTTANGSISISATVVGTTTIELTLMKTN